MATRQLYTFLEEEKDAVILQYITAWELLMGLLLVIAHNVTSINTTPYGRYSSTKVNLCNCFIGAKTAWLLQELPCVVWPLACVLHFGGKYVNGEINPNMVLLGMFLMHYIYRTFIYSQLIQGGKPTPLPTFLTAFGFCFLNGYLQSRALTQYHRYHNDWFINPAFILGHLTFLAGLAINIFSDKILRSLRKPGETGYKIPNGGLFEYVSGANYFGETLEWVGFALAAWSIEALAFAVFTSCVIGTRALKHHKFYLEKFEDYPKSRKAFIPFLL